MITTVTVNPAVDKTYILEEFKPYQLNRAERIIYNAGSKGINVSRVLRILGQDTCVLGFVGGMNGGILLTELKSEGIEEDMVRVQNNTRMNIKVMDLRTHTVTEINESGQRVRDKDMDVFMEKYKEHVDKSDAIVISGSVFPGTPSHIYQDLTVIAKNAGKPVFIDCGGELLRSACKASPDYIKPNLAEFAEMFGKESLSDGEVLAHAKELIAKHGIGCVVVTLGRDGAIGVTADEAYKITPPNVEVVSTVGAGDAFLSGLCHGYIKGMDFKSQLVLATSFSNAKITKEGTKVPSLIELIGYTEGCHVEPLM